VTAVCKNFSCDGDHLTIEKPQIINGAQTVASLSAAPPNAELYVVFRLIKTGSSNSEKGLNSEIIRANNSQNKINLSDFRSNDKIQVWLEKKMHDEKATAVLGGLVYKPKRTARAKKGKRIVTLEELAKIRYAFLYEPLLVHADPKSLWTSKTSLGGRYEYAFGIDREFVDVWETKTFREALCAIALHDKASESGAEEGRREESLKYMKGLRFHALALAGIYVREAPNVPSEATLLSDKKKFNATWNIIWEAARDALYTQYEHYVATGNISLFALKRNSQVWDKMQGLFRFKLRL
jgi:hypothetical protein